MRAQRSLGEWQTLQDVREPLGEQPYAAELELPPWPAEEELLEAARFEFFPGAELPADLEAAL